MARVRQFARRRSAGDVAELEAHLRDQIDGLEASGLSSDEAFLVAVKRMGRLDDLSREFAREHSDRLWKQLVVGGVRRAGACLDRALRSRSRWPSAPGSRCSCRGSSG